MFDRIYKISILTIAISIGILTTKFFLFSPLIALTIFVSSLCLCLVLKNEKLTSLSLFINFIFLGQISIAFEKRSTFDEDENIRCVAYLAQIVDEEKNIATIVRYKDEAWKILQSKTKVKLKTEERFQYGDLVLVGGTPKKLKGNLNPFCFDYKKFLQEQNIDYNHNLTLYQIVGNKPESYLKAQLKIFREKLRNILQRHIHDEKARGVILAMVLGLKGNLKEIQNVYSTTGVVHILAVSGLHVGIIFLLINFILGFLFRKRPQHVAKLILTLLPLWFYAGITGFSPSVLRSTLMCSIMLLCNFFSTKTKVQSSISISALLLLLYDPKLIFNVGFQLSYGAVIGIVLFQKEIFEMFKLENRFLKYFWGITAVTLAAQTFTLPLILFYFQKFPTYFIFSNLFIIPMSSIFVILGLLVIFSSPINFLYISLSYLLNYILVMTNKVMIAISQLPQSSIQGIKMDLFDVFLLYGGILCLLLFLQKEKFLKLLCVICFTFMVKEICMGYKNVRQQILIFYDVRPYWAMSFIKGCHAVVFSDKRLQDFPLMIEKQIKPSLEHYEVTQSEFKFYDEKIKMLQIEKMKICVVNSNKIFLSESDLEFDYVLNNSFENTSEKIKAKEIIFTHCHEDQQMTPQIFVI